MSAETERIEALARTMAWERAIGELKSMMHTFYDSGDRFEKFTQAVQEFKEHIENEGLHE